MKKITTLLALAFCLNGWAQIITTVAGNGTAGFSGDGGQATNAELHYPASVIFDAVGNMYIAEDGNNRIRMINTAGIISTFAGNGTAGYSGDGGPATNAEINSPTGLIFDSHGNLYIVDSNNQVVRKISTSGTISTVVGNGTLGYSGDGGQATAAELNGPAQIAIDIDGNLYIADEVNNRIRKINTLGVITTVVGNGTQGYSGDGGQATDAELSSPNGITIDALGNIYIADYFNYRIRMVNTLGIINTVAGNGTTSYNPNGNQAINGGLLNPFFLISDAANNLYVLISGVSIVREVNNVGIINTIAGSGSTGYFGDGGEATAAALEGPTGLAFDAVGNLYIADYENQRIRKVTNVGQVAGIGQVANSNEVNIYPNPSNGIVNIESLMINETIQITITDMMGNAVKKVAISSQQVTIDVSGLAEGVYNVSLASSAGVTNKRIVIVK